MTTVSAGVFKTRLFRSVVHANAAVIPAGEAEPGSIVKRDERKAGPQDPCEG